MRRRDFANGFSPPIPFETKMDLPFSHFTPTNAAGESNQRYCQCCMESNRPLTIVEFTNRRGTYRALWCGGPRCLYHFACELAEGKNLLPNQPTSKKSVR